MIRTKLQLYLGGTWEEFHAYNRCVFDDRADGQLNSGVCYLITKTRRTDFKPKRRARLITWDDKGVQWQRSFFAYFKGQQRGPEYWMWEVTLVGIEQQVQRQMIDGMRVIQNSSNTITLYDTLLRLCNTTPLRLVGQTPKYRVTEDAALVALLQKIPSPEYAWSCRTLLWECLKEIGCDMGGYLPKVEWYDNADGSLQYEVSFFPTGKVAELLTDLHYISYAQGHEVNEVCSAVDTDIANIIPTNQETASVVYPAPNAWITPRTAEVRLTTDNCKIIMPETIEKIVKVYINTNTFTVDLTDAEDVPGNEALETDILDITDLVPEYKRWSALETQGYGQYDRNTREILKNNTIYWTEDANEISLIYTQYASDQAMSIDYLIRCAILRNFGHDDDTSNFYINGVEKTLIARGGGVNFSDIRSLQFRIEYIPRGNSTKLHAVKQEKCDFESVIPFNQRAEIVDAESLSRELEKEVNQRGVDYAKLVHIYTSLAAVPSRGAAFAVGDDLYTITVNEFEQTTNQNIKVTHTFAKNWALQSQYLKQNKEYRNTNIPTDILARNLHYEDYIVVSEEALPIAESGALSGMAWNASDSFMTRFMDVFKGGGSTSYTEINCCAFYGYENKAGAYAGALLSCASYAVAKSIVFFVRPQNNLSGGVRRGNTGEGEDDDYCYEVFYTNDDGEFDDGVLRVVFGSELNPSYINADSLPQSSYLRTTPLLSTYCENCIMRADTVAFDVEKSSAEMTSLTYQAHLVTELPDTIVGELPTLNSPLVCEQYGKGARTFFIMGLTARLPKTAVVVDGSLGVNICSWGGYNTQYLSVSASSSSGGSVSRGSLTFHFGNMPLIGAAEYVGWALTDETGKIYLARNVAPPTGDYTLYFNYMHNYHGEE